MVGYEKREVVEAAMTKLNTEIFRFKNLYKGFEEVETKTGARTQAIETLRKDLANNKRWWESADPLGYRAKTYPASQPLPWSPGTRHTR